MTRQEHLAWCKQRALEYVDQGDLTSALASMMSDLGKHPKTTSSADGLLMLMGAEARQHGPDAMRRFINGFN